MKPHGLGYESRISLFVFIMMFLAPVPLKAQSSTAPDITVEQRLSSIKPDESLVVFGFHMSQDGKRRPSNISSIGVANAGPIKAGTNLGIPYRIRRGPNFANATAGLVESGDNEDVYFLVLKPRPTKLLAVIWSPAGNDRAAVLFSSGLDINLEAGQSYFLGSIVWDMPTKDPDNLKWSANPAMMKRLNDRFKAVLPGSLLTEIPPMQIKPLARPIKQIIQMYADDSIIALSDPRSLEELLEELKTSSNKPSIIRSVGETQDTRAVITLLSYLKDENAKIREAAAQALGAIRDQSAVQPLGEIETADPDESVRKAAADALNKIRAQP